MGQGCILDVTSENGLRGQDCPLGLQMGSDERGSDVMPGNAQHCLAGCSPLTSWITESLVISYRMRFKKCPAATVKNMNAS